MVGTELVPHTFNLKKLHRIHKVSHFLLLMQIVYHDSRKDSGKFH